MKKTLIVALLCLLSATPAFAQLDDARAAKRAVRKNLTIREWNTDARSKTRWMDRETTFDSEGRKIEETEYASYGQKWRIVYSYDADGRVAKEVEYDDRNKASCIRKFEYNSDGTKKKQYNYAPNGKLLTTKIFEYVTTESD